MWEDHWKDFEKSERRKRKWRNYLYRFVMVLIWLLVPTLGFFMTLQFLKH